MAARREIATRFRLEGEGEYRKAMTDAANALKVLDSEQKLAKAQFEATGDAQAYAAEQARILQEKITEQKRAVQAAEQAIKQLKDNGVSPADKTYQNWAKKLNDANASLTRMQTELSGVEQGMKDTNTEAQAMEETFRVIDPETRFQNTLKAVEDMRDRLNGVVKAAARAARAVWDMETDAGKWADNLNTAASQAGLDVETYQSWQYASRFIDTSVEDITKSVRKMESDLGTSSEETMKVFNQLGVITRNTDGTVRDATDVFWDTVDALGRVKDETTRGIYAQKLLGSHYNALNPLIEAGSKAYKEYAEEGERVAVVDKEHVQALATLNDAQEKTNAELEKTKYTLLSEIAPAFMKITEGITAATEAFNEFLASEEGRAAMAGLNEALSGVIDAFLGEDNGKGTFQSIIEGATGAITGFTSALEWIKENGGTVKAILVGLGIAWAGLNVAPPVMQFLHLLRQTPIGKLNAMFGSAAAGGAASAAAGAATGTAKETLRSGAKLTGSAALHAVSKAEALALAEMAVESAVNMYNEAKEQGTVLGIGQKDENGMTDIGGAKIPATADQFEEQIQGAYKQQQQAFKAIADKATEYWNAYLSFFDKAAKAASKLFQGGEGEVSGYDLYGEIKAAVEGGESASAYTGRAYGREDLGALYEEAMADLDSAIASGLVQKGDDVYNAAIDRLVRNLDEMAKAAQEKGEQAAEAAAEGIAEKAQEAVEAAETMTQEAVEAAEEEMSFLDVVGGNAAAALAEGINSRAGEAVNAAQAMANSVLDTINSTLGQVSAATGATPVYMGGGYGSPSPQAQAAGASAVNAVIMMDKTVVGRMVTPAVNANLAAALDMRG